MLSTFERNNESSAVVVWDFVSCTYERLPNTYLIEYWTEIEN